MLRILNRCSIVSDVVSPDNVISYETIAVGGYRMLNPQELLDQELLDLIDLEHPKLSDDINRMLSGDWFVSNRKWSDKEIQELSELYD